LVEAWAAVFFTTEDAEVHREHGELGNKTPGIAPLVLENEKELPSLCLL
jgi:hypothetical protein